MAANEWNDHVFKHGTWTELSPNVWQITGTLKYGSMTRNMVAAKLPSGGLILHSVIALNITELSKLKSFGRPEYMIVPNPLHRMDAGVYAEKFPNIKVLCPQSAIEKVQKKVRVDGTCEEFLPKIGIQYHKMSGIKSVELCYEFGTQDKKTLVFCDALMNLPDLPGFQGKIMKWLGSTGFFGITKIGKIFLMKNQDSYAQWLRTQSKRRDIAAISVAHGNPILADASTYLEKAANRLTPV